jgi:hypothetical protein
MLHLRCPLRGLIHFVLITAASPVSLFPPLVAQVSTADVVGTVTDESNAVVAGVKVTDLMRKGFRDGLRRASGEAPHGRLSPSDPSPGATTAAD